MLPLRLTLEGFGSYREPQEIEFEAVRLACITGSNGAGKSTLFNGLSWALLGITPTGDIDQLVTEGEAKASAELVFSHEGEKYRVIRTRVLGKTTSATLEHETELGWIPISEKGPRSVDAQISKMIGISKETYASTVLLSQGDSGRFAEADPGARKKILSEILSLDIYASLAKNAREHSSESRNQFEIARAQIDKIEVQLLNTEEVTGKRTAAISQIKSLDSSISIAETQRLSAEREAASGETASARLNTVEMQIEDAKSKSHNRIAELNRQADIIRTREVRAQERLSSLEEKIIAAQNAESSLEDFILERKNLSDSLNELEKKISEITELGMLSKAAEESSAAEVVRLTVEINEEIDRRRMLDHDESNCFTCGQGLDETLKTRVLDDIDSRIKVAEFSIAKAKENGESSATRRNSLRQELGVLNTQRISLGSISDLDKTIVQNQELATSLSSLENDKCATTSEILEIKEELVIILDQLKDNSDPTLNALIEEADKLANIVAGTLEVAHRAEEIRNRIKSLESERQIASIELGRCDERLSALAKLTEEKDAWDKSATKASSEVDDYGRLAKAFGPDGIPNMIFTGVVDELERDASDMMERMTNGKFRLEFRTETTTKDGNSRGTLDVVIITESGERPYKGLSGGERFRVDLALRVALTRLLTRRSGSTIDFLALDEGWGALDPEGITAMLDELRELHDEFPLVLTITHTPEVAAAFEARFEVERDSDGTSVVTLVAS